MNNSTRLTILALLLLTGAACKKTQEPGDQPASLGILNAIPGSTSLVTNFAGTTPITWYLDANKLFYNQFNLVNIFSISRREQPLALYNYPDTTASSKPLYSFQLKLAPGDIRTLFLVGSLSEPDTFMVQDAPPYHAVADSSMAIRLANLAPDNGPVSVTITGGDYNNQVLADNLAYKTVTGFIRLPAGSGVINYLVEFKDQATGTLQAAYTFYNVGTITQNNSVRSRSFTLGLTGKENVSPLNTVLINHNP
ncbi:MAG: hypothetical protein P0Y53_20435 [Candidatus Pseudobacter hemicellulosilyticus]|uniref:DUF4397 domain-containing protein n=1 Tax=Candidatus Pseudobacter hemicellulosilyticus TaxID=3121375 RepID=A0AAJ5WSG3_9BACT|nr:MAG: hypothetical protein P0Y53_20435 [Pseudobacter sp.]